ncbi:GNAT family N-acetyltransferase [Curtobacterium sp. 'Ferrero']|uniref:GNAT family N-acetyltransferase n=1 Tax=Curtobacterium sp. 'Ferrero' TaxID=2033654 RepID=UPI000BD570FF|nr:GNAT family protein [Curtobacterium sp. 'Ferrero']PCN48125.1 GNAT family N-acetyltransferase [Curtobacterium sp. 'Ferrero']
MHTEALTQPELAALAAGAPGAALVGRLGGYVAGPPMQWLWAIRESQVREHPADLEWIARPLFVDGVEPAVGIAGFHAAPSPEGSVEISYEIDPAHRGRGFASRAAALLVAEARASGRVRTVVASVAPSNEASLRIVRRLGFEQVGVVDDPEDGPELVFHLPLAG